MTKLGQLGEFKNGLSISKEAFGSGYPFINLNDIFGKTELTESTIDLVEVDNKTLRQFRVENGDILFVRSSVKREGVGLACLISNPAPNTVYSGFIIRFRPNQNYIYPKYASYYLNSPQIRKQILRLASSSANTNINQPSLESIKVVFPTITEQIETADRINSIDQKINLLTKKKETLETYKKGLMQKIFSQELRFKREDGTDYPNWEFVEFESILFPRSQRNKNCKYLEVYSVSNKEGFIPQTQQFDGYSVASNDVSNYKLVHPNDIVYNPSRINVGSIAINQTDGIKIVSPLYNIFSVDGGYNPSFWFMLRELHYFKHLVDISCSGSVRDSLSLDDLLSFRMNLPSTEEAKRIDKFLSVYDRKISTVAKQLSALNNLKKGLLQQMFV